MLEFWRVLLTNCNQFVNLFFPGNPYKGHNHTVQTQIRCHIVASDLGLHCLLTGFSIKNRTKVTK